MKLNFILNMKLIYLIFICISNIVLVLLNDLGVNRIKGLGGRQVDISDYFSLAAGVGLFILITHLNEKFYKNYCYGKFKNSVYVEEKFLALAGKYLVITIAPLVGGVFLAVDTSQGDPLLSQGEKYLVVSSLVIAFTLVLCWVAKYIFDGKREIFLDKVIVPKKDLVHLNNEIIFLSEMGGNEKQIKKIVVESGKIIQHL